MSRVVFAFMWLAHFLPLRLIAAIGNAVGAILYWLIPERRRVTRINLERCFPQMPPRSRERLARAHFRAFCRSFLERGILWWAPRSRIERMVRIEGLEHLQAVAGGPVILLTPHFVGLEAPLFRISMDYPVASMYSRQKDPLFDRLMYLGRTRFGARLFPRQASVRESLRAIASGAIYYYLPDLDFGRRRSVFVPFFGVPAATVTGLSYIARFTAASVVPWSSWSASPTPIARAPRKWRRRSAARRCPTGGRRWPARRPRWSRCRPSATSKWPAPASMPDCMCWSKSRSRSTSRKPTGCSPPARETASCCRSATSSATTRLSARSRRAWRSRSTSRPSGYRDSSSAAPTSTWCST